MFKNSTARNSRRLSSGPSRKKAERSPENHSGTAWRPKAVAIPPAVAALVGPDLVAAEIAARLARQKKYEFVKDFS